ncbi:hypothetical protein [Arthrobacter sp. UYEF3]|uniref:hypothetical protein n=1 Tax=Arthrobacter sp. UYEF3 TaxID=1756365 RepID=UPI0033958337
MTELNPSNHDRPESAETMVDWPANAGDSAVGDPAAVDPAVDALLLRLDSLPELPVAGHGDVYARVHDGLAAALNEDVASLQAGMDPGDLRP